MNKRQKEVIEKALISEKHMIRRLKFVYQKSLDDINKEIAKLMSREQTQSVIYQKQYQEALKSQIESILTQMETSNFETISEYLEKCYEDGFVGAMYDLHGQGIPIIIPINQESMVRAVATNSKLSTTLYKRLGKDIPLLKKKITIQISRGISSNLSYHEIAKNLDSTAKIGYNNAMRIAQTEGHRIQAAAQLDACQAAKEKGADIVKQWDSTLDSRTRHSHRKADGQLRELDEDFEVGGHYGPAPGHIGAAKEDINCRCTLLQRVRSALDESELKTLKERAEYYGLDKTKDFEDFKKKYLKAAEKEKSSRKGNPNSVNFDLVNSAEYKLKFSGISDNAKMDSLICNKARDMLTHRNNTYYEDMYLFDTESKSVVGTQTNSDRIQEVVYNKSLNDAIKKHKPYTLISMHNHPESKPPSGADLSSCGRRKYQKGIICCHNGDVYIYKVGKKAFTSNLFDSTVDKYKKIGYNEMKAYELTLEQFERDYGIEWERR